MPTRIEIELTSSSPDGSWTWRAAGAREPRGVLDGSILPGGASVGDQLRVETEHDVDGIRVLSVVPPKEKPARTDRLELLPAEESFDPVVQQRAPGGRTDGRGPRRPRRDRPEEGRSDRGDGRRDRRSHRGDRPRDGSGREGPEGGGGGDRGRREHPDGERRGPRDEGQSRRHRPHFTPPPELPQRPKPKRLRPGRQHRTDVLEALPEEQRPIAELALQGIAAVRQRLREDNARLKSEGKPEMPEAGVLKMAEELIPRLRVADWLDRADAARRQLEHLDLRDLRSVVASADDPVVARDESTRALAAELKAALSAKQEEELALWLGDVEAALDVGRVVRALRLSSVPPKAGVPFPGALATRLAEATIAALQPADGPDRWSAVLEAAAFSPVRSLVAPTAPAEQRTDELLATVRRLGPLLPQVAALYGIEVPAGAAVPKPLRPTSRRREPAKRPPPPAEPRRRREPPASDAATKPGKEAPASDAATKPGKEPPASEVTTSAAEEAPAVEASGAPDEAPTSEVTTAAPEEAPATEASALAAEEPTSTEASAALAAEEPTSTEASAPAAEEPTSTEASAPGAEEPAVSDAVPTASEEPAAAEASAPTAPADADGIDTPEPPPASASPADDQPGGQRAMPDESGD